MFTPQSFSATLRRSLFDEAGDGRVTEARLAYAARLFESDPPSACAQLMAVVDVLVEDSQQPDWHVISP